MHVFSCLDDSWICAITKHHNNLTHQSQRSTNRQVNGHARPPRWTPGIALPVADEASSSQPDIDNQQINGHPPTVAIELDPIGRTEAEGAVATLDENSNNRVRVAMPSLEVVGQEENSDEECYVSCLTRLSVGDKLKTARGLVAKSDLSPSLMDENVDSLHLLPTDEGSKIGIIYLPQVKIIL